MKKQLIIIVITVMLLKVGLMAYNEEDNNVPLTFSISASQKNVQPVWNSDTSIDYVIITTISLSNAVAPLREWKISLGYSVTTVVTSWISSNYQGMDLPEKIRNFLEDNYESWGIEYVLIIGSHSNIPMRYCYPNKDNHDESGEYPTDYYYADLTGDWDSDGDGYYGERFDDDVDFLPEVFVGRIPVDEYNMVKHICEKTVKFEQDTREWKKSALLLGAFSNYENEYGAGSLEDDGAVFMEELWNDVLQPNGYSRTTMYEKAGVNPSDFPCDYPLTHSNVLNVWSDGYGMCNWRCHGSWTSASRKVWLNDDGDGVPEDSEMGGSSFIESSDNDVLNDNKPSIVFASCCHNAYPESSNNLGKSLLESGAVAFIGATRKSTSGDWHDENDGGCQSINYFFFKYLIDNGQKCGEALYNAKSYYINHFDMPNWRIYINLYDFCLYGDPSLELTTGQPPTADFYYTPTDPTTKDNIQFTNTSTDDGEVVSWYWDFGDGSSSINKNPQHRYTDDGTYKVTLTVTDGYGETNTISKYVIVSNIPPDALFEGSPSFPKVNESIQFIDRSSDDDGIIVSWYWDFDDGITSTYQNPTHQYGDDGSYLVSLTVTDDDGATDIFVDAVYVSYVSKLPPEANFRYIPLTPIPFETIQFIDTSTDPDGTIVSWLWNFGDDNTSMEQNPTHKYAKSGTYAITFKVADNDGYIDAATGTITISESTDQDDIIDEENGGIGESSNGENTDGVPGFELILVICAIALFLFWNRKRR